MSNIINTELKGLLGIKESPISYNKSMKRYESDIKIKCYDADMKLMDAQYNDNSIGNTSKHRKDIDEFISGKQYIKGKRNYYKSVSTMDVNHSDES